MSWLSWPNSSPMLRSCLSSAITASRLIVAGVAQAPVTAILACVTELPASSSLRTLEEPCPDQTQHQRPPEHDRRLTPGKVFEVLTHGAGVFVPEVIGD